MKTAIIVFSIITGLVALFIFGAIGVSRFVRWLGWPQDIIVCLAVTFVMLAGICMTGWRIGELENDQKARERSQVPPPTEKLDRNQR